MSKVDQIAQASRTTRSASIESPPPPTLAIDKRFASAFPQQAEAIRRFNEEMDRWWKRVQIDIQS